MSILELHSYHGDSGEYSFDILGQGARLLQADRDIGETNSIDGIVVPEDYEQPRYTYVKNLKLYTNDTPERWLGNVRMYFPSRPFSWNGVDIFVTTGDSYIPPSSTPLSGFENNASLYREDSPLSIDASTESEGEFGPWIYIQARVTKNARSGLPDLLPIRLQWEHWLNTA